MTCLNTSYCLEGCDGSCVPQPAHQEPLATIYAGDCVEVMAGLPEASVDAIVTDPPYGLEFMGKEWDKFKGGRSAKYASGGQMTHTDFKDLGTLPNYVSRPAERCGKCGKQRWSGSPCRCEKPDWRIDNSPLHAFQAWAEVWTTSAYRVLKPGGHLLAFGGSRTYHRLACAIEDAGFEVRDCLMWLYGSGFPKSLDVSKAIDKAAGAEREPDNYTGANYKNSVYGRGMGGGQTLRKGDGTTDDARAWSGWGTALKPAHEPIILARKPLAEKNVAANVLTHGTGALNVDGCRIGTTDKWEATGRQSKPSVALSGGADGSLNVSVSETHPLGRWPANVLLDAEAARLLDEQSGERIHGAGYSTDGTHCPSTGSHGSVPFIQASAMPAFRFGDTGGASRFFYTSKAGAEDRDGSKHPTVKPVDLMKWLITLITPPTGVVLDPFLGSGTTVFAARALGIRSIGIEKEPQSVEDAIRRLRQGVLL